jgi:hypothetical protein
VDAEPILKKGLYSTYRQILGIRAQISFFKPACLLYDRIAFLIIEGAIQYCGGNWRGFGWQSEAIQNLLDRCRRIDRAQDSHPAAATAAFQNVQPEKKSGLDSSKENSK